MYLSDLTIIRQYYIAELRKFELQNSEKYIRQNTDESEKLQDARLTGTLSGLHHRLVLNNRMSRMLPEPFLEKLPDLQDWEVAFEEYPEVDRNTDVGTPVKYMNNHIDFLDSLITQIQTNLESNDYRDAEKEPDIPAQSRAIKFDINDGQLTRSQSVDTDGNDYALIEALKPTLLEALDRALHICRSGNQPFGLLADRLDAYRTVMDVTAEEINFALLFAREASIKNALGRAKERTTDQEDADLPEDVRNAVETLLDLHKPIMAASGLGDSIQQASISWDITPKQFGQDKADIANIRQGLEDEPSLIKSEDRDDVLSALSVPENSTDVKRVTMAARTAGNIAKIFTRHSIAYTVGGAILFVPTVGPVIGATILGYRLLQDKNSLEGENLTSDLKAAQNLMNGFFIERFEAFKNLTARVDGTHWLEGIFKINSNALKIPRGDKKRQITAELEATELLKLNRSVPDKIAEHVRRLDLSNKKKEPSAFNNPDLLENLKGLQSLNLSKTQITDVATISNLVNLQELVLSNTDVDDLTALSKLTALEKLQLNGTKVSDLSALSDLFALRVLSLSKTRIKDLTGLSKLTSLERLSLSGSTISDVSALSDKLELRWLSLTRTEVSDISHLSDLTALETLYAGGSKIHDISPLSDLTALKTLFLNKTTVSDVSALSNLTSLKKLNLNKTEVTDWRPVAHIRNVSGRPRNGISRGED